MGSTRFSTCPDTLPSMNRSCNPNEIYLCRTLLSLSRVSTLLFVLGVELYLVVSSFKSINSSYLGN